MDDPLMMSSRVAKAGMKAQAERLRVISENLANVDSLPQSPDALPYRRKTVTFKTELDRQIGAPLVKVASIGVDPSELPKQFAPTHPAADSAGYVLAPNVNPLVEIMDMREAQRSYEANLNVVKASGAIMDRLMDLLK